MYKFLESTDWDALIEYAAAIRNGISCNLLPDVHLGWNRMVRIVKFADQVRWVARLRLPGFSSQDEDSPSNARDKEYTEYSTIQLAHKHTKIPVPRVHAFVDKPDSRVNARFMLMVCDDMEVPPEHKNSVFASLVKVHVRCNLTPWRNDENGLPKDANMRQQLHDNGSR